MQSELSMKRLKMIGSPAPNPSQGSGVKRADGCITGAGWPSEEQMVRRHTQSICGCLDCGCWSPPVGCTTHLWRVDVSVGDVPRETVAPASATPEKLCCTLIPVYSMSAGCVRRHAS